MRSVLRPRLASVDVFASTLLVALGVSTQSGCSTDVTDNRASGAGVGGGSGGSTVTTTVGAGGLGVGGATTVGSGGVTTDATVGSGGGLAGCEDPTPILVDGVDTGIDQCAGGQLRRRAAVECPPWNPDPTCCGSCPAGSFCQNEFGCACVPGCSNDQACGDGLLCLCGGVPAFNGGTCATAECRTGADCAPGEECTSWDASLGCGMLEFRCTTPADACGGDLDCRNGSTPNIYCAVQADGHRECVPGGCAIGRPFLVDDEPRLPALAGRADWCAERLEPGLDGLDGALRAQLAEAWERAARMEHASIAAFGRFSLQLLAHGAPADLVERTNQAMIDETKHARLSFSLASAYRGQPVGPGALAIDGALEGAADVASMLRLVVREGCVGETVAAFEAGEGEGRALDPIVRGVLGEIAADESQHAELAWRAVRWALTTFGAPIRSVLAEELALLDAEMSAQRSASRSAHDETLLDHGIATPAMRAEIRRTVVASVVLPCLRALVNIDASRAA